MHVRLNPSVNQPYTRFTYLFGTGAFFNELQGIYERNERFELEGTGDGIFWIFPGKSKAPRWNTRNQQIAQIRAEGICEMTYFELMGKVNKTRREASIQRERMEQPWWGSPPWTSQDKGGLLDAQDGRGSACALGRGSPHRKPADPS